MEEKLDPNRIVPGAVESLADRRGKFAVPQIIVPKKDRVLVRVDEEVKGWGMLALAETTTEAPLKGVVVAVGKGRLLQDGTPVPVDFLIGDRVTFNRNAGNKVNAVDTRLLGAQPKEMYYLLREDEVTAEIRCATDEEIAVQAKVDEIAKVMAAQSEAIAGKMEDTIFEDEDDSDLDAAEVRAGDSSIEDEEPDGADIVDDDSDLDEKDED